MMNWNDFKELALVLGVLGFFFLILLGSIGGVISWAGWYSSCKEAQIYNRPNSTSYTCSDFFWAGDQINQKTQTLRIK